MGLLSRIFGGDKSRAEQEVGHRVHLEKQRADRLRGEVGNNLQAIQSGARTITTMAHMLRMMSEARNDE